MQYHVDSCDAEKGETYRLAKEFGQQLLENCREALAENPVYKDGEQRTQSHVAGHRADSPISQSPSRPHLTPKYRQRATSSTLRSSERT